MFEFRAEGIECMFCLVLEVWGSKILVSFFEIEPRFRVGVSGWGRASGPHRV